MNNYQLYRTNVLLGGQMKYDLILSQNSNNHNIDIKDIHITPISNNAPYNKYVDDDVLNYNHIENIKTFYKKTSGSFYKTFINPILNNLYPLPNDYDKEIKETTYEMGCRRKSNQLYDKQFEFLCPVWLEQISNFEDLSFEIQIKTSPTSQNIITKKIVFKDKLAKYFDDYIKLLRLDDTGYDWVFNISKQNCIVSGVDVKNGTCKELRLSNFYNDLLYRERPVLEVNNLIINELNKHNLIARQLFNFNLCFNISDILGFYTFNQLKDYPLYINVIVCINDKPLDLRDIFSNHEYIDKSISQIPILSINNGELSISKEYSDINVLDYLNDNKHIDLVDKNKILQNTCHWEYSNIKGSIFNLYDGFCGVFKAVDNTDTSQQFKYYNSKYYNGFSIDLNMTDINEIGYPYWCNAYKVQNLYEILCDMINDTSRYQNLFSTFSQNCVVNNINYHAPIENMQNIDVIMLQTDFNSISEDDLLQLNKKITEIHVNGVRKWYAYPDIKTIKNVGYGILCSDIERKIIILVDINNDKLNNFLYRNLMNLYTSSTDNTNTIFGSELFKELCEYLSTANRSGFEIIQFSNRLTKKPANSPDISSKEIEYFKINAPHINKSVIARSFGKIKPYFIKNDEDYKNYTYSKMKYNEMSTMYKTYSQTLYEPRFPSIEYFAFKYEDTNYNDLDKIDTNVVEFHNYTINKILHLEPILKFEEIFILSQDKNNTEEDLINQCIEDKYEVLLSSITDEKYKDYYFDYIKSKYILNHSSIECIDFEKDTYNYKIQLKLK